ncbi:MAG: hypothetical protein JSV20_00700 [Candidatus Bathyarchaeota archaeon]|nr:MAG: hypothetical protein JSV20_00700 [Candidatus Bathyarchaeota archaeon]
MIILNSNEGKKRNIWFLTSLLLIIVVIVNAGVTIYYYQGYTNLEQQKNELTTTLNEVSQKLSDVSYAVDILIKYKNDTKTWYNQTLIPIGWSFFNATIKITNGNMDYDIFFGSPFITEIYGEKAGGVYAWLWFKWDETSLSWISGETGADGYMLKDEDIVAWYLADTSTWPDIPTP